MSQALWMWVWWSGWQHDRCGLATTCSRGVSKRVRKNVDSTNHMFLFGNYMIHDILVGGLEPWNFMTFHSVGNVIPTDFHSIIFFRGVGWNHQLDIWWEHLVGILQNKPCDLMWGIAHVKRPTSGKIDDHAQDSPAACQMLDDHEN